MKKVIFLLYLCLSLNAYTATYDVIHKYVRRAPEIKRHDQLSQVVSFLTGQFSSNKDRAYAFLAWIVYNIDYDDYTYRQAKEKKKSVKTLRPFKVNDIIQTRLGICLDIANLYTEMLTMAGIPARTISGCIARRKNTKDCQENPHAWNAVWIDDRWELVDPTFAMGNNIILTDVSSDLQYKKAVNRRQRKNKTYKAHNHRNVNVDYFMISPNKLKTDHQPTNDKWYLTNHTNRVNKELR